MGAIEKSQMFRKQDNCIETINNDIIYKFIGLKNRRKISHNNIIIS